MKKLFSKIKWHIAVAVTVFGATFWATSSKEPGKSPDLHGGINADTVISIKADTTTAK